MALTDSQMGDASDADVGGASASVAGSGSGSGLSGPGPGPGSGSGSGSTVPPIGVIKSGRQYLHENTIRRKLAGLETDLSRDEAARLQGVQLIDDVRNVLQLCVSQSRFLLSLLLSLLLSRSPDLLVS